MGHPMKVSEAVAELQAEILHPDMRDDRIQIVLASHEALRLAGEEARSWLKIANVKPYEDNGDLCRVSVGFLRALSLAVEDASK